MTNGEIARRLTDLQTQMAVGFGGVNTRLDRVNGQLDTHRNSLSAHAVKLGEHSVKLTNLNREVFDRPDRDEPVGAAAATAVPGGDDEPITMRQLKRFGWVIGAVFVAIEWLPRLLAIAKGTP
ncbi:MAG: hypothetical protein AB7R67_18885 [Vicinamibacterales bacterium]